MGTEHNRHDDAIDKVLAVVRDATPPEGMEARVLQRLHQQTSSISLPITSTFSSAWWRGAFTGAATATLAAALIFFAGHLLHLHSTPQQPVANATTLAPAYVPASINHTPADSHTAPCARQASPQDRATGHPLSQPPMVAETRIDTSAPSRPAPPLPLTPEERALVQLARTADPKVLATPDPETQAKLEAQEAAAFKSFFSPKPEPPAIESNE